MYTLPGGQSPDSGGISRCLLCKGYGVECCEYYQQASTAAAGSKQCWTTQGLPPLLEDRLRLSFDLRVRQHGTEFSVGNKTVADGGG